MVTHSLITLSDSTASLVSPFGTHSGVDITIQNVNASGYIYVGNSTVSEENYGYRVLPNHAISIELNGKSSLYVVASVNGMKVAILRTNLESGS